MHTPPASEFNKLIQTKLNVSNKVKIDLPELYHLCVAIKLVCCAVLCYAADSLTLIMGLVPGGGGGNGLPQPNGNSGMVMHSMPFCTGAPTNGNAGILTIAYDASINQMVTQVYQPLHMMHLLTKSPVSR